MWNPKATERGNSRSVIRELFAYGETLRRTAGEDAVADLSLGNPATPPPAAVTEAFRTLLATEDPLTLHGYTAAEGDPAVRASIAAALSRRYATGIGAEHLFLTAGAAPALTAVFVALTEAPGDEFIALAPYFPEYSVFATVAGGVLRVCPCDPVTLLPDTDALASLIGERTRGVIVNSPNNPSGVVYDRVTLARIAACLTARSREIGHSIYLISDEPYRELVYGAAKVPYVPALYPETVVRRPAPVRRNSCGRSPVRRARSGMSAPPHSCSASSGRCRMHVRILLSMTATVGRSCRRSPTSGTPM